MFKRAVPFAIIGSALAIGCGTEAQPSSTDETQEIISNLVQAGFPSDDIMVADGVVYVGRDAAVSLLASREMLQNDSASGDQEQYRTTNLLSSSVTTVCVNGSAFTGSFSTALDNAIARYNAVGLTFTMKRTTGSTSGCSATITAAIAAGVVGGSSGFPSGGLPYGTINIGSGLTSYATSTITHVIMHELGHTIGFRHSDYYNRAISCGGSSSNEGSAGVGAILISGTPSTATVGGSVMNSCFRSNESGEWTSSDRTALQTVY